MQPSRRTLLAAVLLLATVSGSFAQTLVDDSAFLSGNYGFAGGYYGSYTNIPTYLEPPAYTPESPAPQYGYYSYGYDVQPPTYTYGGSVPTPTYYYTTTPTTPTFYYDTPTETTGYYYTAPSPSPSYAPSYYPTTYSYSTPAIYYSPPAVAPSTCPPCPTCSSTFTTRTLASAALDTAEPVSAAPAPGTCYCPYDSDWKTWAVADPTCRTALYSKCKSDSRLACTWLDQYYSASSTYTRPFEQQIFAFLYSDCAPAPPCACAPLTFTSADSPAQLYTCCRQLQTYSQIPYSGLSQSVSDAFCSSGARAADVKAWVTHALWHATCPAAATTSSAVFTTARAGTSAASTTTAQAGTIAPVSSAQQEASAVQTPADRRTKHRRAAVATAAAAAGGAVGGALFAAGVTLVVLHLRRPRQEGTYQAFV